MSLIELEIPIDLLDNARKFAEELNVSLEAFLVSALTDRIAMRQRFERLKKASSHVTKERFLEILRKAPDVGPEPNDRIE